MNGPGLEPPPARGRAALILFWEFAKITTMVIGGGYVILTAAEAEFVRRRRWISQQDFLDLVALSQTIPGIIACNGAIYIGSRVAGLAGAVAALFGTVLPPMIVIVLVAAGVSRLPEGNPWIDGAFLGVNACIVGMILATAVRLGKKAMTGAFEWLMAAGVLVGMVGFGFNPGWLMVGAIPCGILRVWYCRRAAARAARNAPEDGR